MEDERQLGRGRYRVYQIIGLIVGVAFIALGVVAFFAGGGPFIAAIAVAGGLLAVIVSVVDMVRS
ncbi:hypothetical protein ACFXP7_02950 [Microbacterium sp. P06]|uniref:hypothetical protein n=1 Tax=unclassified Microbacterium TaxID=2609290 RepID=UPI0037474CC1